MARSLRLGLLATAAASCLAACKDPTIPRLQTAGGTASDEWPVEACIGECPAHYEYHAASEDVTIAPPGTPHWAGESAPEIIGEPICPPWIVANGVILLVTDEFGRPDEAVVNFGTIAPPTAGAQGVDAIGAYIWCSYPTTTKYSIDRRYRAYPGAILVKSYTRLTVSAYGKRLYVVQVSFQKYTGEVYRVFDAPPDEGGGGGAMEGWAYRDIPNAINRAMPDLGEGDAAAGQYITGGGCRAGWDIWVNGEQVCYASRQM